VGRGDLQIFSFLLGIMGSEREKKVVNYWEDSIPLQEKFKLLSRQTFQKYFVR